VQKITRALTVAAVLAVLVSCAQPAMRTRPATPEDLLAAAAGPEQKKLWRAALDAGTVPPVQAIQLPPDPVGAIRVVQIRETETAKPPALPESVATAVIPVTLPDAPIVVGRAQVIETSPDRIRLRLEDGRSLEFVYRSPSREAVSGLAAKDIATVEIRSVEPSGPMQRYSLAIGDAKEQAVLVALQDSGDRPVAHEFRIGQAKVRQIPNDSDLQRLAKVPAEIPPGGQPVVVEVTIGGRAMTLRPGDIADPERTGTAYAIVVYESSMHAPEAAHSDTPVFSLHVAIFAVRGR